MKRKYLIVFGIILASLLTIGVVFFLLSKDHTKSKDILKRGRKPKNDTEEFLNYIPGLWQNGKHIYYRFFDDGTGHTWDTRDDVNESEASPFHWKISKGQLVITFQLKLRGTIPRMYQIDYIDWDLFQFHDSYSKYTMQRVNR